MKLDAKTRKLLFQLAWQSLEHGLEHGSALEPSLADLPKAVRVPAACFVTLHKHGELRGCIGSLQATEPLARAVAHSAFSAGFRDPRFPPLHRNELGQLELEISVLGPMQDMNVSTEQQLLAALRPGVDGLLLEEQWRHAVYLPSVWEQLPDPLQFVQQLKLKGGWRADYWSSAMRARRFQTELICQPADSAA